MRRLALIPLLALFVMLLSSSAAFAADKNIKNPKAGSIHHTIIEGLKLIKAGDFDGWMGRYCHGDKLCPTATAKASLKRYNLPALKRLLNYTPSCLRAGAIIVTREDGDAAKDPSVKVYVKCRPDGMPRPFSMRKVGKIWKFDRI